MLRRGLFVGRLVVASPSKRTTKTSMKKAWLRHVTRFKFGGPIRISGMTEARAVKFSTQVGYIKSYQKVKNHNNGRGYGHATYLNS